MERTGPLSFKIQLSDGRIVRRHQDQMRTNASELEDNELDITPPISNNQVADKTNVSASSVPTETLRETIVSQSTPLEMSTSTGDSIQENIQPSAHADDMQETVIPVENPVPELRRSTRTRKAPSFMKDYVKSLEI